MSEIRERKETGRIEAFSDGVLAIAITLLVVRIKVPKAAEPGAGGGLGSALIQLWPHYLSLCDELLYDSCHVGKPPPDIHVCKEKRSLFPVLERFAAPARNIYALSDTSDGGILSAP